MKPSPQRSLPSVFKGHNIGKEFARLEMKIFATRLIQHCDWQLLPDQDLSLITIPTPHPRDGLKVTLTSL